MTPHASDAESNATTVTSRTTAVCSLIVDYNLNLRDQPTTDGSKVFLSIPAGTAVTADVHTTDVWYSISFSAQKGWGNDDYLKASASLLVISRE